MRVTIIPEDKWIRRDDQSANLPEWPFEDANIHAIQWYEDYGEIERNGTPKPQNELFTNPTILEPYISALETYAALLAEQAAEAVSDEV